MQNSPPDSIPALTTTAVFDPYEAWLGIPLQEQPADHYRLLGLARFENDAGRIERAADERMALVRSYQVGPRGAFTQKLLNELSAARVCLLTPASKAQYDAVLGQHLQMGPQTDAPPRLPPPAPVADQHEDVPGPEEEAMPRVWSRLAAALVVAALLVLGIVSAWSRMPWNWPRASAPAQSPPQPVEADPPAPQPIVILQEGSGEVVLSPATATLAGQVELHVVGTEEVLAHWTTPEDRATWQFRLVKPGPFEVELTYATSAGIDSPEVELTVNQQPKVHALRPSGGLDQFQTDKLALAIENAGQHSLVVRPVHQPAGDWLVLKTVRLVPARVGGPPEASPAEPAPPPAP